MAANAIFTIIQGEQYAVEIIIKNNETEITPENCDDVKIKIGNITKKYSKNEINYENERWLFPLTQEESLMLKKGRVNIQAQYMVAENVYSTDLYKVQVDLTTIRETW